MNSSISSITLTVLGIATLGAGAAQAGGRPSIADLQAQIAALQASNVPGLASYVSVDQSVPSRPIVRVAGANLQVVNGTGTTNSTNGVGNVIVGYDDARPGNAAPQCSLGAYTDQGTCQGNGGTWAVDLKSGSHNVVIGPKHNYSQYAGLVVGLQNTISGAWSSVSGGQENTASGGVASVSGGYQNFAAGAGASVSGGTANQAAGYATSVSGGLGNTASNNAAAVSGGQYNVASGYAASVSGGELSTASSYFSSVSGGAVNTASGQAASVSGGYKQSATGMNDWVGGALHSP
jgi:hypothetical protein